MKTKVTKKKHTFDIQFTDMTKGEVFALINALRIARRISAVAFDVSCSLRNGFHEMKSNPKVPKKGDFTESVTQQLNDAQEFMDIINEDYGEEVC